jgi:hypothetical protein
MVALTAVNAEGWEDIKNLTAEPHGDGLEFTRRLHPSISACRHFCGRNEILNEPYLMLLMLEGTLMEILRGDLSSSNRVP